MLLLLIEVKIFAAKVRYNVAKNLSWNFDLLLAWLQIHYWVTHLEVHTLNITEPFQ